MTASLLQWLKHSGNSGKKSPSGRAHLDEEKTRLQAEMTRLQKGHALVKHAEWRRRSQMDSTTSHQPPGSGGTARNGRNLRC